MSFFHSLKYHYTPRDEEEHQHEEDEDFAHGADDTIDEDEACLNGHSNADLLLEMPLKPDSIAFHRSQRQHESERARKERRRRRRKCIRLMGPLGRLLMSRRDNNKCERDGFLGGPSVRGIFGGAMGKRSFFFDEASRL